jgi:hypothetical protein
MGEQSVARRMWVRMETYHDVTYFTPESRAASDALGCKGGWMGYFGMRAAPMGAVTREIALSAFYNFHPSLLYRAIPDAWAVAAPERYLETRLAGVDGALRRMLGDDVVTGPEIAEAAGLARAAADAAPTAGRPLGAANAALPWPDQPHLVLWQASTILRESRGDGHIAALVTAELDPCETLVIYAADHGLDPAYVRKARGWPEQDWADARSRLADRGLLDADGALTEAGAELRRWVEERTDSAADRPWRTLGTERTDRLAELVTPLGRTLADANEAMRLNPMALDSRAELARSS